jgi:multidrug efflux pump
MRLPSFLRRRGLFSRFFIDRPIFASVLSIVIVLAGALAYRTLPLAMYPPITPPIVQVDCNFPGASAEVVAESIASPIEQQVNGVENMLYMSSQCTNDGSYSLTIAFNHGVNLNLAQVLVQNRVNLAIPSLPEVVKQTGLRVRKKSPDILMTINIYSPDMRYDQLYLSNYAFMNVREPLARLTGVSDIFVLGQRDYSMRIWVDPERLAHLSITASEVARAIRDQNFEVAVGQIGQPPMSSGQVYQIPLSITGRLSEIEQFKNIILKSTADGRVVKLKDVARITLSARNELTSARVDLRPSIGLAVFQLPDANALETADRVLEAMKEMKQDFPEGMDYQISYDTTPYTRESINNVFTTLIEAVILVAIVVLLFLQNWRSAIIPLMCVPVAIIGTFAVMAALGFSLNNLTLFGLVLAIGIVVDDAIVVVEAVEHHIEHGLPPRLATIKAMEQVSGPVIAVGLVLSAVFIPCAFISGVTGQFFRQFALTIAVSTVISAFNSLTLSPALAAILLKPRQKGEYSPLPRVAFAGFGLWLGWRFLTPWLLLLDLPEGSEVVTPWIAAALGGVAGWLVSPIVNGLMKQFFGLFNRAFRSFTHAYTWGIRWALRGVVLVLLLYVGLLGLTIWSHEQMPRGFIPSQDMGYLMVSVQLPDAASMERTRVVMDKVEKIAKGTLHLDGPDGVAGVEGVAHTSAITGRAMGLDANGSNFGSVFVMLDEFGKRREPKLYSEAIIAELRRRFSKEIPEAQISVTAPPPVRGVGRAGGFKLMIKDHGDQGARALQGYADNLVELGNNITIDEQRVALIPKERKDKAPPGNRKALTGLFTGFRANVPSLFVDIDRAQALAMEVPYKDATDTMQIYLGSMYVNDFSLYGRNWQVVMQADMRHRDQIDDVRRLQVRNKKGKMVPLGSILSVNEVNGPLLLTRYNQYPAASITGSAGPGISSGESLDYMEQLAKSQLPDSMSYEWTELAYLQRQAGNDAMKIFGLAVLMVFLVLAAQYESVSLPFAVILVVPMCILCAVAGVAFAQHDINIFTQIGFVVLVGLASKNAILIVEYAKHLRESGSTRTDATLEACRLRLRPIIMTSLAFILGVLPLLLAQGAGAEMRRTLGTAVFAGMLGVTIFGLFLTPVFFYVIDWLSSTPLFRSREVQLAGAIVLHVLGFLFAGFIWIPLVLFRLVARRKNGSEQGRNEP